MAISNYKNLRGTRAPLHNDILSFWALILTSENRQFEETLRISNPRMFMPFGRGLFVCLSGFRALGGASDVDWQQIIPPFFMIHIGQLIKQELDRQERTPTWLARKINCERPNVYYIFSQQSINTDLLLRISRALNHDFFQYYTSALTANP